MACQICGKKAGYYPLCKECNKLKESGKVTKCIDCGKWNKNPGSRCYDCYLKSKRNEEKKSDKYKATHGEIEEKDFREKFPATIRAEDGHKVRSRAEQLIDNWLYHKGIVHAYERRVPIEEEVYSDFFIPIGQKVWIEFWGLTEQKYEKRKKIKQSFYKKYDKNLIELTDDDIEKLDDIMPKKLIPYLPKSFSFD